MFFFKKSKITLDVFTYDQTILETSPILPAIRFYPQWMKDLPGEVPLEVFNPASKEVHTVPKLTIKACSAVQDYFKTGFIIPLWTDVSVIVNPDGRYSYSSADSPFSIDRNWPMGGVGGFGEYANMRFTVPWHAEEKSGVKFLLRYPAWSSNTNKILINKFVDACGIIDFKDQHSLHLNTFFELPYEKIEFILKLGTPIGHIIPLTEKEVELKLHLIDESEWIKRTVNSTGAKTYTSRLPKKLLLKEKIKEGKGCPFKY